MILMFIKLSEQYTVNDDWIVINSKMIFDLKWKAIKHNKKIFMIRVTIKNWLNFMNVNLILMIQWKSDVFLNKKFIMINVHNINSLFNLFFLEFKFVLNKIDVKWQINAAYLFCNIMQSVNQQWWSLLLNQDVDWLQTQMFVQINNIDINKCKKAWNTISSLFSWNNKQKNILHNDDKFHSEICLFKDLFNTEKTKVLTTLTLIYLLCSFHIILMTSMKAAFNNKT